MQATGTLRDASTPKRVWLWVVAVVAGMLLAAAAGYLAHGSGNAAGTHPTAAPTVNEPQPVDGLQP